MNRWRGKVALVTGASSGIGHAIAEKLVQEGLQVVGVARRHEVIEELAKSLEQQPGKLYSVKCDISKTEDIVNAFKWTKENVGPVQILINNAGGVKHSSVIDGNPEDFKFLLETNVLALTTCIQQAARHMRENNLSGHVINISSITANRVVVGKPPIMNLYSPSKAAVNAISEVMNKEFNYYKLKIKVTNVSPSITKTGIIKASGGEHLDLSNLNYLEPSDIADVVAYILSTPPHVLIRELCVGPLGDDIFD